MTLSYVSDAPSLKKSHNTHQLSQHSCSANLNRLLQKVRSGTEFLKHLHRRRNLALSPQRSRNLEVRCGIHLHVNSLTYRNQARKIGRRSQGLLNQVVLPSELRRADDRLSLYCAAIPDANVESLSEILVLT